MGTNEAIGFSHKRCHRSDLTAEDRLYFKQLLAGTDFAEDDPAALQMANFAYLIGDGERREALVVDPAYDIAGLIEVATADEMSIVGALGTHYHADHVGGSLMGYPIEGIAALLDVIDIPIHVQGQESEWIEKSTGVSASSLVEHQSGDIIRVGDIEIRAIHTPGHTPGSQCFLVEGRLVAGDTLFLNGCGRTDLPGGDPNEMYRSLYERLAKLDDGTVLYPGHLYSPQPSATLGQTRRDNYVFRPNTPEEWLEKFSTR